MYVMYVCTCAFSCFVSICDVNLYFHFFRSFDFYHDGFRWTKSNFSSSAREGGRESSDPFPVWMEWNGMEPGIQPFRARLAVRAVGMDAYIGTFTSR